MSGALALRVWGPIAVETVFVTSFVVITGAATRAPGSAGAFGIGLGVAAGVLLFALLARELPRGRFPKPRTGIVAFKGLVLVFRSTFEEMLWRGIVLGVVGGRTGLLPAYALSSVGFAALHARPRARRVHLVSGASFGGLYLATHGLPAPIAAHATYNLLVLFATESARAGNPPRASPDSGPQDPELPVRLRDVTKTFGCVEALRGVSLDVRHGEVLALLGPNGAGKTTLVNVVLGLRRADAGDALVFGMDPRAGDCRVLVGATPQESAFPGTLRVCEIVAFAAAHFPDHEPVDDLLGRFGLAAVSRRQVGGLSPGERRRLALALAFLGRPKLVVLDEPTTGLDIESRRTAWEAIRVHAERGGTSLLTTHYLEEVEALASKIAVLARGRVVATGTAGELAAGLALKRVRFSAAALPELPAIERAVQERGVWEVTTRDAPATVARLVGAGVPRDRIEVAPAGLEETFLALTGTSE
jgi:ABC-2 type transport system ATP-binding protein